MKLPGILKDDQCHAKGLRPKACGGYYEFLVYGEGNVDRDWLEDAVDEVNAAIAARDLAGGAVSDCAFLMPPRLRCVDQRCAGGPVPVVEDPR